MSSVWPGTVLRPGPHVQCVAWDSLKAWSTCAAEFSQPQSVVSDSVGRE